ncbi:MAG: hypothetical protein IJ736_09025 [Firmicutes bacterium]|nr:hypothetical protein [Bacillota bacterium]
MKAYKKKSWQYETTGTDGDAMVFGVNIFDYEWCGTGKEVEVKDPLYGLKYMFSIYTVTIDDKEYQFACGEFSNCVYGFFVYKY